MELGICAIFSFFFAGKFEMPPQEQKKKKKKLVERVKGKSEEEEEEEDVLNSMWRSNDFPTSCASVCALSSSRRTDIQIKLD